MSFFSPHDLHVSWFLWSNCVMPNFNETSFDSSLMVVGWLKGGLHKGPEPVWVRPWLISAAERSSQRRSGAATWTRCFSLPPPGHPFIHPDKPSIFPIDTVTICEKRQTATGSTSSWCYSSLGELNGRRSGNYRSKSQCSGGHDEHRLPLSPG